MRKKKKVAVGLSGGVDSSVAAYLLKKKGFDVVGFTLKFFPKENRCCDLESLNQAQRLCAKLNIPHYSLDVKEVFNEDIIKYFVDSYTAALTPNPCVFCNRLIKFGLFLDKVKVFDVDYLATGHYVRLGKLKGNLVFRQAKDKNKSQEYFLSLVKPEKLNHLLFPLASYTKPKVKQIPKKNKLIFKERGESQDVCFVGDKSYIQFIKESVDNSKDYHGNICHVNGEVLGKHKGYYNYTYGQRSGLGIGWKEPLYVVDIIPETKTVVVGEKEHLARNSFLVENLNWFANPAKFTNITVKVRYNSKLHSCNIQTEDDRVAVGLKNPIDAITPGQVAAFYYKDFLLGGGIIARDGLK